MPPGDKRPGRSALGSKKSRQSAKADVNDHEKELAKKLGGRRQLASGALDQSKGDVKLDNLLLDSKETIHGSITVKGTDLTKICREATGEGLHPGMILTLGALPMTTPKEWVLVPLEVFVTLLENQI